MEYAWFVATGMLLCRFVLKGAGVADIIRAFRIIGLFDVTTIGTAILGFHKRS
jgi:hypothetical protein